MTNQSMRCVIGACSLMAVLAALAGCTTSQRAWVTSGFDDFSRGTFDAGGDNLYVSRNGGVQMIRTWDVNNDGHVDLFFGQSHDHTLHTPTLIYPQRDGRPSANAVIKLPANHSGTHGIDDLNGDGEADVILLNTPPNGQPVQRSFIYWGGPQGLSPKYRTMFPTFGARQVFAADFDGDGLKDMIVNNGRRHRFDLQGACLSVYRQTEPGLFPLDQRRDIELASIRTADAGDLDGDGLIDVVLIGRLAAEDEAEQVYLLKGQADGLGQPVPLDISTEAPTWVRLLSIDDTSRLIVLSSEAINLYAWSDDALAGPTTVANSGVRRVAVADVNKDGRDDLICRRSGHIDCLLGSEAGFAIDPAWSFESPKAGAIAVGDLTGDGRADVAVAFYRQGNTFDTKSRLYVNSADGFDAQSYIEFQTYGCDHVRIADIDNDFRNDVIFSCAIAGTATNNPPLRIYLSAPGAAENAYRFGRHIDLPADSAYGGFITDYNNDGFVDVLVTNEHDMSGDDVPGEPASFVYWGDADGLSPDRVARLPASHVKIPLTADLNRDGYLDIVLGSGTGDSLIYYGGADGFTKEHRQKVEPGPCCALQLADVDRDGWLDMFAAPPDSANTLLLWGSPEGFDSDRVAVIPVAPSHMEVADLDSDGWLDLIFASGGSQAGGFVSANRISSIWWGSADGYSAARRTDLELGLASREIAIADLNKDGHLDLVFSNYRQATRRIFDAFILWGNQDRAYSVDNARRLRQQASLGVQVADLNDDTWPDIVFCDHSTGPSHQTMSRIHWNRQGRFTDDDVTLLPTLGPHNTIIPDLGNAYTRKLEEVYTSVPFERTDDGRFTRLSWQAQTKHGTSIVFQVRSAATRDLLDDSTWIGPRGEGTYFKRSRANLRMLPAEHHWIQYRAILRTTNGAATPVLTRVEVSF